MRNSSFYSLKLIMLAKCIFHPVLYKAFQNGSHQLSARPLFQPTPLSEAGPACLLLGEYPCFS